MAQFNAQTLTRQSLKQSFSDYFRLLSIMPNRPRSEISGTTQGKWNDIFLLNRANQLGIALATSYHFRIP